MNRLVASKSRAVSSSDRIRSRTLLGLISLTPLTGLTWQMPARMASEKRDLRHAISPLTVATAAFVSRRLL